MMNDHQFFGVHDRSQWGKPAAILALLLAAVASMLFAGSGTADAQSNQIQQADLDAAEALWAANGPTSYQYSYTPTCFCPAPVSAVYTVVNGQVTTITQPGNNEFPISSGITVDDMFAAMQSGLDGGAEVSATFDPVDGHPRRYLVNYDITVDNFSGHVVGGLLPTTTPMICAGFPATMLGTPDADTLWGSQYDDVIVSLAGNDTVDGGLGDDTVCAGAGADEVSGDAGVDVIYGEGGHDRLYGGTGDDVIFGQGGADRIIGNDGDDDLFGGPGYDTMEGNDGDDFIQGSGGNDNLAGGNGDDDLFGKAGDDTISGGEGNDQLYGSTGNDEMSGGAGADRLQGAGGNDILNGDDGDDLIYGQNGNDDLDGGPGNDVLYAASGDDHLLGGPGIDSLQAGSGNDDLDGGDDDDVLFGQAGDDELDGGLGDNSCYQGPGSGPRTNCDATTANLDGTWALLSGTNNGEPIALPQDIGAPTMTITGSGIGGDTTCNSYGGGVFHDGVTFIVGSLIQTQRACPGPEFAFLGALGDVYVAELSTDGPILLELTGRDSQLTFIKSTDS